MTLTDAIACAPAWLLCWALASRWCYRRIRPWTEPLNCSGALLECRAGRHQDHCYFRWSNIGDNGTALSLAVLSGALGPLVLAVLGAGRVARRVVAGGDRELPAESVVRLQRELGELDGYIRRVNEVGSVGELDALEGER